MRLLGLALAAAALAATLSACGKSSTAPSGETGAQEQAAAPTPKLSEADMQKALTALPAPYNTADLSNGEAKFALCASCHTLTQGGPVMTGPNLYHILGEKAGVRPGFKFSEPMKAAGFTWDAAHLDTWITDPKAMLPGTKMTFAGLKDPKDRTDVIAYVMIQTGYQP